MKVRHTSQKVLITFVNQLQLGGGGMEMESNFQVFILVISNFNTILEALKQFSFKKGRSFKIELSCRSSTFGMGKIYKPMVDSTLSATLSRDAAVLEESRLCSFSLCY